MLAAALGYLDFRVLKLPSIGLTIVRAVASLIVAALMERSLQQFSTGPTRSENPRKTEFSQEETNLDGPFQRASDAVAAILAEHDDRPVETVRLDTNMFARLVAGEALDPAV